MKDHAWFVVSVFAVLLLVLVFSPGGLSSSISSDWVRGGSNLTVTGCVPFENGTSGTVGCDGVNYVWDNTGKRLGINNAVPDAPLLVSQSTGGAATGAPSTGTLIHMVGPNGVNSVFLFDGFSANAAIFGRNATGTIASPGASTNTQNFFTFQGFGHQGGANGYGAVSVAMNFTPDETFSLTAHGSRVDFFTTPDGTTTLTNSLRLAANSLTQGVGFASAAPGATKFTITGCSAGTTVGGATAGQFASGTTGTCTVVITMNGATGLTAPNGWACSASDITAGHLAVFTQSASTPTTCTISATTTSGDTVVFHAMGY